MKDNFLIMKKMAQEFSFMQTGIFILVNFLIIKSMEEDSSFGTVKLMEKQHISMSIMMAIGLMDFLKEKESSKKQMEIFILVVSKKEQSMDKEVKNMQVEIDIKDNFTMDFLKVMENILGLMEAITKEL